MPLIASPEVSIRTARPRYRFLQERIDNVWVKREACGLVRGVTDALLGRFGLTGSVYYLVDVPTHP